MKAKDIFGIILRVFALWVVIWGAWQLTAVLALSFSPTSSQYGAIGYLAYGLPACLGGLLVLRFADDLVDFTYRRPAEPRSTEPVPFPPIPSDTLKR